MSRRRVNRHRNKLKPRLTKAERRAAMVLPKPRRWPDLCYEFKPRLDPLWQETAWYHADAGAYHEDTELSERYEDSYCGCCCCTGECQSDWLSEWDEWWMTQSA